MSWMRRKQSAVPVVSTLHQSFSHAASCAVSVVSSLNAMSQAITAVSQSWSVVSTMDGFGGHVTGHELAQQEADRQQRAVEQALKTLREFAPDLLRETREAMSLAEAGDMLEPSETAGPCCDEGA